MRRPRATRSPSTGRPLTEKRSSASPRLPSHSLSLSPLTIYLATPLISPQTSRRSSISGSPARPISIASLLRNSTNPPGQRLDLLHALIFRFEHELQPCGVRSRLKIPTSDFTSITCVTFNWYATANPAVAGGCCDSTPPSSSTRLQRQTDSQLE